MRNPSDYSKTLGAKIQKPGNFLSPVTIEGIRPLGYTFHIQVRTQEGKPDETVYLPMSLSA